MISIKIQANCGILRRPPIFDRRGRKTRVEEFLVHPLFMKNLRENILLRDRRGTPEITMSAHNVFAMLCNTLGLWSRRSSSSETNFNAIRENMINQAKWLDKEEFILAFTDSVKQAKRIIKLYENIQREKNI